MCLARYDNYDTCRTKIILGVSGSGFLAGGATGAGIGSLIWPGVGTFFGGLIGAGIGATGGAVGGDSMSDRACT